MKKRPKHEEYPWERWFTEEQLDLYVDVDFDCSPHIMAQQFRNKAQLYIREGKDLRVSIKIVGDLLRIWIKEVK